MFNRLRKTQDLDVNISVRQALASLEKKFADDPTVLSFLNFCVSESIEQEHAGSASRLSSNWYNSAKEFDGDDVLFAQGFSGANTVIAQGVKIGPSAQIGPGCIVGAKVEIGEGSQLVARVTVLAQAQIGRRVILHPGVVIGSDGFGLARVEGGWEKVPQLGSVHIGNDVEIGANSTVDRGSVENTLSRRV